MGSVTVMLEKMKRDAKIITLKCHVLTGVVE